MQTKRTLTGKACGNNVGCEKQIHDNNKKQHKREKAVGCRPLCWTMADDPTMFDYNTVNSE